ncbi:MAG TPA: spore coat protein [Bacillales bacterium]|nr:spore coat protein [Bacillales bacterium]
MSVFGELKKKSTNNMIDLLVDDIFEKHQIQKKVSNLTPEKKEKIRGIVSEIQQQLEKMSK